ncbi:hypothetical protein KM915_21040 [Cytobacillus oceanisediminis]|uniref:hypothetical protein n=1 Tax=Cytobacillus oceanisediminis TaxID=665099 RepID=UPI001C22EB7B|nr:hypothetical protein [Cytobacillus oceanisediminis]MBU8732538.1 hypothetical protein [Cytobacillus oceanisediminis]
MTVDDHVIDSLRRYFDDSYEELKKEWKSNQYEILADCPSFKATAAYHEAIKVLTNGCNFPEIAGDQLKRSIEEEAEVQGFWKELNK